MSDQIQNIPGHVSIIMDGNGRWAVERGRERVFGHSNGVESVKACIKSAMKNKVRFLSLFAFSEENWGRPKEEVDTLMSLMMKSMSEELHTFMENSIRFVVLGNRERLSDKMKESIAAMEDATLGNEALTVIVFLSYSGKWDISQAAARMAAEGGENIEDYLVTAGFPDPDLIIRTSGEKRLSNFLLWQAAYSEMYFPDILWPDFREKDFEAALLEYSKRDRRYGKVK